MLFARQGLTPLVRPISLVPSARAFFHRTRGKGDGEEARREGQEGELEKRSRKKKVQGRRGEEGDGGRAGENCERKRAKGGAHRVRRGGRLKGASRNSEFASLSPRLRGIQPRGRPWQPPFSFSTYGPYNFPSPVHHTLTYFRATMNRADVWRWVKLGGGFARPPPRDRVESGRGDSKDTYGGGEKSSGKTGAGEQRGKWQPYKPTPG